VLTSVKIEHNHWGRERSLNPTSTASTVDVGFSHCHLLHPPSPQLAPNCGHPPTPAPPLARGMWASEISHDQGIWRRNTRGNRGSGRPRWCVTKTGHDSRRGPFSAFLLLSTLLTTLFPTPTRRSTPGTRRGSPSDAKGPTKTRTAQRRRGDCARGTATTRRAARPHDEPNGHANLKQPRGRSNDHTDGRTPTR